METLKFSKNISEQINNRKELFTFNNKNDPTLLLIVDRKDDWITPLITQWTYNAMIHEFIEIMNNKVCIDKSEPTGEINIDTFVLSEANDKFYSESKFKNYGDFTIKIRDLLDEYHSKTQTQKKVRSLSDIRDAISKITNINDEFEILTKHMEIILKISTTVGERSLLDVSKLEQEILCLNDHDTVAHEITEFLEKESVYWYDKYRIVVIYILKYKNHTNTQFGKFVKKLSLKATDNEEYVELCSKFGIFINHVDSTKTKKQLAPTKIFKNVMKIIETTIEDINNVYTQYKPVIYGVLDDLLSDRLDQTEYPIIRTNHNRKIKYNNIIIFYTGGVTFGEVEMLHSLIQLRKDDTKLLIGGSNIHNSQTFLKTLF
jgi:vacuolar protein sorting-associated protein 45